MLLQLETCCGEGGDFGVDCCARLWQPMPSTTKRKTNDPVLRFIDSFRASINSGSLWSIYCDRIRLPFYHPSVFETDLVTCDFFGVPIAALHHYYANVLPGFRIMGQKTRIKRISIMIALSLTPSGECETEGQCDHEKPTDSSFAVTHYWQTSFLIKPAAEVQVQRSTSPELGGIPKLRLYVFYSALFRARPFLRTSIQVRRSYVAWPWLSYFAPLVLCVVPMIGSTRRGHRRICDASSDPLGKLTYPTALLPLVIAQFNTVDLR